MADYLKDRSVDDVAAWYLRLADGWDKRSPSVSQPLAGAFLRAWVMNRTVDKEIEFEAPQHLKSHSCVYEVQAYHREVFLSSSKARFSGGKEKWAGVLPRIQGASGFTKWDMKSDVGLEYESLCDIAPNALAVGKLQLSGNQVDIDIFGSLRGFQLKSKVSVGVVQPPGNPVVCVFKSWMCSGTDRYDWDTGEHLTVPNPDFQSKLPNAIRPGDKDLTVYHTNAKRLEAAGRAAPFKVVLKPWLVADARIMKAGNVDITRKL